MNKKGELVVYLRIIQQTSVSILFKWLNSPKKIFHKRLNYAPFLWILNSILFHYFQFFKDFLYFSIIYIGSWKQFIMNHPPTGYVTRIQARLHIKSLSRPRIQYLPCFYSVVTEGRDQNCWTRQSQWVFLQFVQKGGKSWLELFKVKLKRLNSLPFDKL